MSSRQLQVASIVGAIILGLLIVVITSSTNPASGFSALFSFGLLVLAGVAARTGLGSLRQVREDSKSRSRPMVGAELRAVPHVQGSQTLVIRNYGPSIARKVEVTFDPPLPDAPPEQGGSTATAAITRRYAQPIAVMMPGTEWDNLYLAGTDNGEGKFRNALPHPNKITVTISYESDEGDQYEDAFPLDVGNLLMRTFTTSPNHPDQQALQNRDSLGRLAGAAEAVAGGVVGYRAPEPPDIVRG